MRLWLKLLLLIVGVFPTAALAAAEDERTVDALARQFWTAEVRRDWGAVYDMFNAAARGSMARDQYIAARKEDGPLHYQAAEVDQVTVLDDVAWVHVNVEYVVPRYPFAGSKRGQTWQTWQKTDRWRPLTPEQQEDWPALPPQLRPVEDEAALVARASAYWQARAAQDWRAVYPYLRPEYRAAVPLERFLRSKAKNLYFTPRAKWAEVKEGNGRVKILFFYKSADPAVSKTEPTESGAIDSWIKVGGTWYLDVTPPPTTQDDAPEMTN